MCAHYDTQTIHFLCLINYFAINFPFAYNKINGSHSPVFDEVGAIIDQTRPNSQFYTAELVYVPFGKDHSYSYLMNLRTSLQYIGYSQVNGTSANAQFNNTFMVNGWLAF